MQSSDGQEKKIGIGGDSLCNLAVGNGYLICVRNIEGYIAPQQTVEDLGCSWLEHVESDLKCKSDSSPQYADEKKVA